MSVRKDSQAEQSVFGTSFVPPQWRALDLVLRKKRFQSKLVFSLLRWISFSVSIFEVC